MVVSDLGSKGAAATGYGLAAGNLPRDLPAGFLEPGREFYGVKGRIFDRF